MINVSWQAARPGDTVPDRRAGSAVGATHVWDKLRDGNWVSDSYLATPGQPGYTAAVPRC
jgi:hypothetical protein